MKDTGAFLLRNVESVRFYNAEHVQQEGEADMKLVTLALKSPTHVGQLGLLESLD
jgi:hypothetical protein